MRRGLVEYENRVRTALEAHTAECESELERLRTIRRVFPDLAIDDACPPLLWTDLVEATHEAIFETCRGGCDAGDDDPAGVYATPCAVAEDRTVRYTKDYLIGTRTRWGIVAEPGWGRRMEADGVPERVIATCAAYLDQNLAPVEVRRAGPAALPMARRLATKTWRSAAR